MSVDHEFRDVIIKTAEVLHLDISNLEFGERADRNVRDLRNWIEYVQHGLRPNNKPFNLLTMGNRFHLNGYRKFTEETLEHFGVTYAEAFNRILVPIYDHNGMCVGCSMRRVNESDEHKWLHRPRAINTKEILYNLDRFTCPSIDSSCIIVEGCFDVMNLYQLDIHNAIATFGAHLTDEQCDLICSRFIDVTLAYDSDQAGINATRKAMLMLKDKVNLSILDIGALNIHDPGDIENIEQYNSIPMLKWYDYIEKYGI